MKRYSQNDSRWSRKRLGNSSIRMGGHGCTTTSIAMGLTKFFPRSNPMDPGELAGFLKYTDDGHPLGGGLILWGDNKPQWKELGIKFEGRYFYDPEKDNDRLKTFAASPNYFVIVEVLRRDGGRHWLHLVGKSLTWRGPGWAMDNPWKGTREWKTVGYGAPYVRITGWALFHKL